MIVVVGGTGRVGRQVVTQLTGSGRPVRSVSRGLNPGGLPSGAEAARADLTDPGSLEAHLQDAQSLFVVWPFTSPEVLSQPIPVLRTRDLTLGYRLGQRGPDLRERKSGLLAYPDHGDPAQHVPAVAPLIPGGAVGADQSLPFVEPQSRRPRTAAFSDLAHGQPGLVPVVGIHRTPVSRSRAATSLRISP